MLDLALNLISFETFSDKRGHLVSLEAMKNIPFEIKRVYYIWGVGEAHKRGAHAHKNLQQVIVAVHGKCTIVLEKSHSKLEVTLDSPNKGLLVQSLTWEELINFSDDCVLMVIASDLYNQDDYIVDYESFLRETTS